MAKQKTEGFWSLYSQMTYGNVLFQVTAIAKVDDPPSLLSLHLPEDNLKG